MALASFLVFAGIGSWLAGRLQPELTAGPPVVGIVLIASAYVISLPHITEWLHGAQPAVKVVVAVALVAPIAILMGMPFPLTLNRLRQLDPSLVPLAWGANGCASVVAAVLATLLAIHFGQTLVIGCAAFLYVLAAMLASRIAVGRGSDAVGRV